MRYSTDVWGSLWNELVVLHMKFLIHTDLPAQGLTFAPYVERQEIKVKAGENGQSGRCKAHVRFLFKVVYIDLFLDLGTKAGVKIVILSLSSVESPVPNSYSKLRGGSRQEE